MPGSGPPLYFGLVDPSSGAGDCAPKYPGQ